MAKTTTRAGKRALAAGRDRPRTRKSGGSKALRSRQPKPAKSAAPKQKPSLAPESARLKSQLKAARVQSKQALERQTATADILKVIASSPSDVQAVFDAIVTNAKRLIGGLTAGAYRFIEGVAHLVAFTPLNPAADEALRAAFPRPIADIEHFRLTASGKVLQIADTEDQPDSPLKEVGRTRGYRSILFVPLKSHSGTIGTLTVTRRDPGLFSTHYVQLLQTFGDQAVIAIENARLFNETKEALEQQRASANVLNAISNSVADAQPVFDEILRSIMHLFDSDERAILLAGEDGLLHIGALRGPNEEQTRALFPVPVKGSATEVAMRECRLVQYADVFNDPEVPPVLRGYARRFGKNYSSVTVPLLWNDKAIGSIMVGRTSMATFSDKECTLLRTFADQAVIAIQNARLFEEAQARTRDLSESLQQQTATADVLKVISRSAFDLDTVMHTLARSAAELCAASLCGLYIRESDFLVCRGYTAISKEQEEFVRQARIPVDDTNYVLSRALSSGEIISIGDFKNDRSVVTQAFQEKLGFRSLLIVPMLREGQGIGLFVLGRDRVGEFSRLHIELVQTFADQAVIAIENARLFDEVQAKTRDLTESLQQQTATADVLKIISRSAFDLQAVLDTLTTSAVDLLGVQSGTICVRDGEVFRYRTAAGAFWTEELWRYLQEHPIVPGRGTAAARAILSRRIEQIPDFLDDPDYTIPLQTLAPGRTPRAFLGVPLLGKDRVEGAMSLSRQEPGPFTQREIDILQTFADQAVIAIENARLFDEVQARTRDLQESLQQQTATGEVLKVISRSAFNLQTVFDTLAASARELCEADVGVIFLREGDVFYAQATAGARSAHLEFLKVHPRRLDDKSMVPRVARTGGIVHIPDIALDPDFQFPGSAEARGVPARSIVGVPLVRNGTVEGVFVLSRREPRPFTQRQIELVESFSDQAIIALENVRLFDEVQARTRELAQSLDDLRSAQDRLIQTEKLASLGQLTAGIAHEIKNPLNFVNNFSALSVELTDELNEALKQATMTEKIRAEVDELTGLLKDNLAKVVQHGKRADSIVKNMLLHSREGSGEHRLADINALVDESLNLAYHGARAENPQFNVTLRRDFDAAAGMVEVFPQEITRVLLNLISNGFHAVNARKMANVAMDFEPLVTAATRAYSDHVEICIRDNGTGIPPDVKEKMFNPFFTTKPAGEGTGLGLSMSHDIIVKQHGGRIEVDTEPGVFTEFIVTLHREGIAQKASGETK